MMDGVSTSDIYDTESILPCLPQQIALQLIQHIFVDRTMCLKGDKRGDMRIIDGLELCIIPTGVSSSAVGPLVNAAFDLEKKVVIVGDKYKGQAGVVVPP